VEKEEEKVEKGVEEEKGIEEEKEVEELSDALQRASVESAAGDESPESK